MDKQAKMHTIISVRGQLREIVAGRPASGWKEAFSERIKQAVEQGEYEEPLEAVFISDHPEWKNPHERGTDAWLVWEMDNLYPFQEAFKKWLKEQEAHSTPRSPLK